MSESVTKEDEGTRAPSQSGIQIWLACALFIIVPALLILVVKYFFAE